MENPRSSTRLVTGAYVRREDSALRSEPKKIRITPVGGFFAVTTAFVLYLGGALYQTVSQDQDKVGDPVSDRTLSLAGKLDDIRRATSEDLTRVREMPRSEIQELDNNYGPRSTASLTNAWGNTEQIDVRTGEVRNSTVVVERNKSGDCIGVAIVQFSHVTGREACNATEAAPTAPIHYRSAPPRRDPALIFE